MGSTEIIVYVCAASLALGFLICWLAFVLPARWEIEAHRMRSTSRGLQKVREDMDEIAYRAELRNAMHHGTPYIARPMVSSDPMVNAIARVLDDNDRWSRTTPDLKAVDA